MDDRVPARFRPWTPQGVLEHGPESALNAWFLPMRSLDGELRARGAPVQVEFHPLPVATRISTYESAGAAVARPFSGADVGTWAGGAGGPNIVTH